MAERPDWQPISRLPLIGSMIDAMLQDAEEHYQTLLLLQASPKPHVLDDYVAGRVFEVFGSQKVCPVTVLKKPLKIEQLYQTVKILGHNRRSRELEQQSSRLLVGL